ncbi:amidohydrolase family protein [Muricoccus radiodurans]|uniref:amidohydrolase family protein n=1 Tax=Muricoccus radiodurans TaxID=2231721 RepID=UPI003CF02DED
MPDEVDLLVRADFLYPMSPGLPVIADGEVAIRGDRIVHAGPARPAGHWKPARTIARRGSAVLPGFVNAHCHTASIVFRSQTDDGTGGVGLAGIAFRMEKDISDEEWRVLAEAGCADMLRSGVTTINDIWYAPWHLADSVSRSGLRAQIAHKVFDVRLEELHRGDYTRHAHIGEARLKDGVAFAERWNGAAEGRITARIGTHATDTCSASLHREARAEATRLGIGMHIHTAQTVKEVAVIQQEQGCGPLEYLRDIGMLAPDVVCAHLSYASDADLDAMAETGARYAHCPTIYPRRGRYPRLDVIRARGIPTGFGTDWMQNDPFEGMRNAINVMRVRLGDPDYLPTAEALWLHTMGAATVLGLEREIGSLEPGKKADLILVDLNGPHLQPYYGDHPALVFYARVPDVAVSIVDGQVVLEDGRPTRLDPEAALSALDRHKPGWSRTLRSLGGRCVCCG